MKRFLSAVLAALLPSLAPHNVEAEVIDVIWTGGMVSDYSVASNWSPQVVPNNGNGGNNYRVTIDRSGPNLDMDATVDALTLKAGGNLGVSDHTFSAASTRIDASAPNLVNGLLFSTPAGGIGVGGYTAPAKADLGLLANYNTSTNVLESGVYRVSTFEGGPPAELTFKGARIATNAATIFLRGGGRITDEFGNDALEQLAVNNGILNLSQTSFQTVGDFTNNGELDLVPEGPGDTVFVISGQFTNFDPKTKTLTGGRYVLHDPAFQGETTLLQFRGADIVTNAADIFVARRRDGTLVGAPSIVDEHGADAFRNFANNAAGGRITFHDFSSPITTTAHRVTNAGYMSLGALFNLPTGGVFEQFDGELLITIHHAAGLDTHGGSIHLNAGRLTGGGSLRGSTFSNAVISPGSNNYEPLMIFEGDLALGPASVLRFDIRGTRRGPGVSTRVFPQVSGYDAIDCTGSVTIDGELQVTPAFHPALGDTFVLVQAQTPIAGSFSNVANGGRLTTTDGRGSFIVNYGPNTAFDPKALVLSDFQPNTGPAVILNISTRGQVGNGERVMIGGFIITGSEPKPVIVRAIGPSLRNQGVAAPLGDPTLRLHDHNGATIASNDDWQQSPQWTEIQASGIPPSDEREAAIVATLAPGSFTAVLEGKNGATGVGLVEIYDLNAGTQSQLANISTRGYAESGDNALIGGIIIGGGTGSTDILMRALGPSLSKSGVMATLANPGLSLRNQQMELYGNDDWRQSPQQADIQATGIPPSDDRESALIWSLAPGGYTAIVAPSLATGTPGGVGLVEFYRLQ